MLFFSLSQPNLVSKQQQEPQFKSTRWLNLNFSSFPKIFRGRSSEEEPSILGFFKFSAPKGLCPIPFTAGEYLKLGKEMLKEQVAEMKSREMKN